MMIPHSRPTIGQDDIKAVVEVLASGNIAQGAKVKEFENAVARFVGVKHGVAVSSGTSALHLALLSLGVKSGDEIIIPSYVCSSPYFASLQVGGTPKIADINLEDFNLCAETVKERISPRTKAIIVPHMFGTPAELDELLDLGFPIIEDCAHSLGAEYNGQFVGSFGDLSVFSFYATKMITTGEGGMVLTSSDEFYSKIVELREYDKKPLAPVRYNYKMTDFQAALGLSQLKKLHNFIKRRREIASLYSDALSDYNFKKPSFPHKESVFYRYVVMVEDAEIFRKRAKESNVMCEKPVDKPLHKSLPFFKCPNADKAFEQALSIPIYPSLSEDEIEYLLKKFNVIFAGKNNSCCITI